ncbi:Hypothetical protein EHI5A_187270 [Entamoeba histolytica KU27]|uniref:Uncharacterized protein n=1 Tax=Entamoeba histolytica KU27 TaxID=885311 RepID=M2RBC4_ENTHI|nr:Hypothetical protein EHI5A_187270 [Entamoeba histolytica KU27]
MQHESKTEKYQKETYDEKTQEILKRLEEKYPFLNFFFKDIPEMTIESIRKTRNRLIIGGVLGMIMVIFISVLMVHSLMTFEDDPNKTFVENLGYIYYYTLCIGYFIPTYHIMSLFINVAWIYFKFN